MRAWPNVPAKCVAPAEGKSGARRSSGVRRLKQHTFAGSDPSPSVPAKRDAYAQGRAKARALAGSENPPSPAHTLARCGGSGSHHLHSPALTTKSAGLLDDRAIEHEARLMRIALAVIDARRSYPARRSWALAWQGWGGMRRASLTWPLPRHGGRFRG